MLRDIITSVDSKEVITPQANTSGSVNGDSVDLQGYGSCAFLIPCGTVSSTPANVTIQESDDGTNWSDVADEDTQNSNPLALDTENTVREMGYNGYKRYVRLVKDDSGTATLAAVAILGHKEIKQAKFV